MNVVELFKGVAVIIDDQVDILDSEIYKIKNMIMEKKIPVLTFPTIPEEDFISSFYGISFIILDWDFTALSEKDANYEYDLGERVNVGDTYEAETNTRIIGFIKRIINELFIPIYIFSGKPSEEIEKCLEKNNLWDSQKNRIFVIQKNEIKNDQILFDKLEEWTKRIPSVYVLKNWNAEIQKAKNLMFNELYSFSPEWPAIIWNSMVNDCKEFKQEYGDFLTRSIVSRIEKFEFEEEIIKANIEKSEGGYSSVSREELKKVFQGERFIKYMKEKPKQSYTGDLFKDENGNYKLNISAQCSIARSKNPSLLLVEGKACSFDDITKDNIRFSEEKLCIGSEKEFLIADIKGICMDEEKLDSLNGDIINYAGKTRYLNGTILEKEPELILSCVDDQDVIKFNLSKISVEKYNSIEKQRVGRVLPPYITRIQQKSANFLVREGVMPIPAEFIIK